MYFFLLINIKLSTIVGIITFMTRKNRVIGLSESEKAEFLDIFIIMTFKISRSAELSMIFFITSESDLSWTKCI